MQFLECSVVLRRHAKILITALLLILVGSCNVNGLQLSMVTSRRPSDSFKTSLTRTSNPFESSGSASGLDITGGLISQLAVIALKLRLADHTDVSCDVKCKSSDLLLRGRVGPVTVKGRGWKSGLGLTCRAIEATVDVCELDPGRILSNRKLVLTTPAKGKAMVALTSEDFCSFITHPLLRPPGLTQSGSSIEFLKDGTLVDPAGTVTFFAKCLNSKWKCVLKRGAEDKLKAVIEVEPANPASSTRDSFVIAEELTDILSRFFNEMVFELDGTFLSFRDMMVTSKAKTPSVMLSLNILVRKFPSPGIAF